MALSAAEIAREKVRDTARARAIREQVRTPSRTSTNTQATPNLTPVQSAYGPSGNQEASRQATARLTANLPNMRSRNDNPPPVDYSQPVQDVQPIPAARTPRLSDFSMPNFRDPEYNAQIASLNRALQDFETGAQQRGERYGIDYLQGVRNIGYRPSPGFVAMPNILEAGQEEGAAPMARSARAITGAEEPDATAGMQGQWDLEGRFDPYSAASRGTRGLRDEFAARGTLRSSDFGQTFGEFQNRLNEQLEAMETGRTRFAEDLSSELAQQRTGTEERRQAAERAAINRAATAQMNAYLQALGGG